jgi:DNA-binding SARP family transcriptional activator/WD40 repeat protein
MPAVDIAFLGPLQVDGATAALSPRDRMVLAALAVRDAELSADQLAAAVWGHEPPGSWLKQVHICVMRLRKALGPDAIETTARGYRLALTGDELDTHHFEALVERGRVLAADGEPDRAASTLARALALWRGEPFGELDAWPPGRAEAARLAELRRSAQEDLLDARLASGEHRAVAAEAEVLVADEPLRERRWAELALAQYRSGRQADALRSLNRARRTLVDELGIDPGPELVSLEAAILRQDPSLLVVAEPPAITDECPYKGLAAYDEGDIDSFFGRDADVAACLARLEASRLLAVAGPSGCGKSSLVRAGLAPALRRRHRAVAVLVPGVDPDGTLSDTLAAQDESTKPLLVIDQFEDLFTLGASAETVGAFCARLVAYAEEQAPVVVVVRSDHVAALGAEPALARLVEQGLYLMGPLRGDVLRAAIEGPAQQAGLRLEPGLVDLLARDTEDEPGALPLLSHALVETWRRRDGRVLTVEGYRATGGIRGAVARSADRLYESLPAEQRTVLRSLLLRLVAPVPDGEPVRSRVASRALGGDPARERVLGLLVRARLVTAEEDTVELAHEALARAWPRLRAWLDDDAAGQRILRHLAATAEGWEGLGRPADELYRGVRLDAALEWRESARPDLTAVEAAFLDASAAAAAAEGQAAAARARHQARQNRRLRGLLTATATLLVVALAAGLVAVNRSGDARDQRDAARAAQEDAQLEALVNRSLALRPTNGSVAALLAVEAYRRRPDARAWSALLGAFQGAPGFMGNRYLPAEFYASGALVPGTSTAVIALDGRDLKLVDLDSGELEDPFPPPTDIPATVPVTRVSGDGRFVALYHGVDSPDPCYDLGYLQATDGRGCAALTVFALDSGRRMVGPVTPPFAVGDAALNNDGSLVAVSGGYDGDVALYRTVDGQLAGTVPGIPRPDGAVEVERTAALAFAPDGRLVVGSMAGPIRVVDPTTVRVVGTFDAPPLSSNVSLAVLPSGVLVASGDDTLVAIDMSTGGTQWSTDGHTGREFEPCSGLALAVATGRFYCASQSGVIEERDLATGQRTGMRWEGQLGAMSNMAITSDGRELVVFGGRAISRWRVDGSGPVTTHVAEGQVVMDGYDPTGETLLVAGREQLAVGSADLPDYAVWDPVSDQVVDPVDEDLFAAMWAGPNRLAAIYADGTTGYYDVADRRRVELGDNPDVRVPASRAWLSAGGSRLYVSTVTDSGCEIRTYDPAARTRVDPTIELADGCYYVGSLSATPDGERVAVIAYVLAEADIAGERSGGRVTTIRDGTNGEPIGQLVGNPDVSELAVSDDLLVASEPGGDMTVYDLSTLRPEGRLAGGRAPTRSLTFSADGTMLLATSQDDTVSLYDVATRTRIGEPIPARSPTPDLTPGFLRPDGRAVAVTDHNGIAVWDLAPDHLADAACQLAGRNLTRTEWGTYLAGLGDYRATCPELPPDADTPTSNQ